MCDSRFISLPLTISRYILNTRTQQCTRPQQSLPFLAPWDPTRFFDAFSGHPSEILGIGLFDFVRGLVPSDHSFRPGLLDALSQLIRFFVHFILAFLQANEVTTGHPETDDTVPTHSRRSFPTSPPPHKLPPTLLQIIFRSDFRPQKSSTWPKFLPYSGSTVSSFHSPARPLQCPAS